MLIGEGFIDMRSAKRDLVRAEARRKTIHCLGATIPLLYLVFPKEWLLRGPGLAVVLSATGATIADGVPLQVRQIPVNENLTIPLVSGCLVSIGSLCYGSSQISRLLTLEVPSPRL